MFHATIRFSLIRTFYVVALFHGATASAKYVTPMKASNQESESRYQERQKADRDQNGPLPYPPGYKVAFADKEPQKSTNLKKQKPVTGAEAVTVVKETPGLVIIDLRTPEEFHEEHVPGAINVSFVQAHHGYVRSLAKLDPKLPTLIYCDTGGDTAKARLGFGVYGFETLYTVRDGLRGWIAAGGSTEGAKTGRAAPFHRVATPDAKDLPPTPRAEQSDQLSDGPFPVIQVSNDFALTSDFAFDGHGGITSGILTFLLRKRADVVAKPFRTFPDPLYPREHVKDWNGIRLFHADVGGRDHIAYRADGSLLRPYFPARGLPSNVRCLTATTKIRRGESQLVFEKEERWSGKGVLSVHTDTFNQIWCGSYSPWTRDPETRESRAASLNLINAEDEWITLLEGGELEMPYSLVRDDRRSLLYYSEPLKKQIWVLPVDRAGKVGGEPRMIVQLKDSEPWGLALDEFGNLYAAAEPNVLRFRTAADGSVADAGVILNAEPVERAHAIHFGHGPGFSETSLYVMSTPQTWRIMADALTGYVLGTERADGTVTRHLENVPELSSPLVRIDLGVTGAPETLVKIANPVPDNYPDGYVEDIEEKRQKFAF